MATKFDIKEITALANKVAAKELKEGSSDEGSAQILTLIEQVNKLLKQKGRGNDEIDSLTQQVDEFIKGKKS